MIFGLASLLVLGALAHVGVLPRWLFVLDAGFSGVLLCLYAFDKAAARRHDHRVPEVLLHMSSLLGGWPGAAIGQQMFRHKRQKMRFLIVYWLTVLLNVAAVTLLWLLPAMKRLA